MTQAAEQEQLLADLQAVRDTLVTRGHCQGYLINPEDNKVCMVGAAGVAMEGNVFIEAVFNGDIGGTAESFAWSERGQRVIEALADSRPRKFAKLARMLRDFLHGIVKDNDEDTDQEKALAWLDRAIEEVRKTLPEPPKKADRVATLAELGLVAPPEGLRQTLPTI